MIFVYRLIAVLLYPCLILLIFFRKFLNKEDQFRYKEKIFSSYYSVNRINNYKLVWFHAASVGEVQSIFPLIKILNKKNSNLQFLITTVTLTSAQLIKKEFLEYENITHRYLPLDVFFLTKKFLNLWKPDFIFFIDSEIWPNLILNIREKNIPLGLINGRVTKKTFRRWKVLPVTAKKIFESFEFCLASSQESKNFLKSLGAQNVQYIGNIKFSNKIDFKDLKNENEKFLKSKKVWCAASTHQDEDEFSIKVHVNLKEKISNLMTIIAPRHIHRSKKIKRICENYNLEAQILNEKDTINPNSEIIIINSFGVLPTFFKYSKSVFVGKSTIKNLENDGGQNPIIAAQLGCKIYHGPYVYNFREIYQLLNKNLIANEISSISDLTEKILIDFKDLRDENLPNKMIEDIGEKILNETTLKINNKFYEIN